MEKFTVEMIELYLEDKLDSGERKKMDAAMALNPELKEELMLQKILVQKIKDQALRSLIHDAHLRHINSGNSGFLPGGKWILGIIFSVIVVVGFIFYFIKKDNKDLNNNEVMGDSNIENIISPISERTAETENKDFPEVPFMVYKFFAEKGAVIKDRRSGAVIIVPANILSHKDGTIVKGEVTLKYREFRTWADFALSGIPMTYKEQNFDSEGMFEIYALQNEDTLGIMNNAEISMKYVMTKDGEGIGFYKLDEKSKEWEFIHPIKSEIRDEADTVTSSMMEYISYKDPFIRSLLYQKAAIGGKVLPVKPRKDFNTQFTDNNYKQIAGVDTNTSNRIVVEEINKQLKKKESKLISFFKRIFLSGGAITIPINTNETTKVDTSLSIVVKDKRYAIYENGRNVVMEELASLKGTQFVYDGNDVFDRLTNQTFYDVRFTRDTTVLNQFYVELKTDREILKYQLKLSKPEVTSFEEYEKQQKQRILSYNKRIALKEKEYQDLIKLSKEKSRLLDSLSFYGKENVFQMARLIMTEDELNMSQREWFSSLDTNRSLRKRADAHLDSIKAYGDDSEGYINKLASERKVDLLRFGLSRVINQGINQLVIPGQYIDPLVRNLRIKGFGVYNCDQVYRMKNPILIKGKYVTKDKAEIINLKGLSLIDPTVNAAFSFDPKLFQCNSTGDNMILLFTSDKKIYFFDRIKWKSKQVKKDGMYTFEMTDITDRVRTSGDLQKILEGNLL